MNGNDFNLDTSAAIALGGIVVSVLGVLAARWGKGRSTGDANSRGPDWREAYSTARDTGYGIALLGVLLTMGALFARCAVE